MIKEFNGYAFNDFKHRKQMKYIVISVGDLDINNAYAFTNKKDALRNFTMISSRRKLAIFKVEDITPIN